MKVCCCPLCCHHHICPIWFSNLSRLFINSNWTKAKIRNNELGRNDFTIPWVWGKLYNEKSKRRNIVITATMQPSLTYRHSKLITQLSMEKINIPWARVTSCNRSSNNNFMQLMATQGKTCCFDHNIPIHTKSVWVLQTSWKAQQSKINKLSQQFSTTNVKKLNNYPFFNVDILIHAWGVASIKGNKNHVKKCNNQLREEY